MFLIEYDEGLFVDGEEVNWIEIKVDSMKFTMKNDPDWGTYSVSEKHRDLFVDNLEALNGNANIESAWHNLKKTDAL